ncbi:MAG: CDP-alcohol phosphatidyltransferase family protein, partial [Candidatus Hydrogenedentota bacterium]
MTLPNKISLFRLLLIPAFVAALLAIDADRPQLRWLAAGIYVLAAFSDAVDGYLARRWQQTSELGALLDPLADKLLVNIALVFL